MPNTVDVNGPFLWNHYTPPIPPIPPIPPAPISEPLVLRDIKRVRELAKPIIGNIQMPLSLLQKIYGIKPIEMLSNEPDPTTYNGDYYYNTTINRLYVKIKTAPVSDWKSIGHDS